MPTITHRIRWAERRGERLVPSALPDRRSDIRFGKRQARRARTENTDRNRAWMQDHLRELNRDAYGGYLYWGVARPPKEVRVEVRFSARPGEALVSADLVAAFPHIIAAAAQDAAMLLALGAGDYCGLAEILVPGCTFALDERPVAKNLVNAFANHQDAWGAQDLLRSAWKDEGTWHPDGRRLPSLDVLKRGRESFRAAFPRFCLLLDAVLDQADRGAPVVLDLPGGLLVVRYDRAHHRSARSHVAEVWHALATVIVAPVEQHLPLGVLDGHDGFLAEVAAADAHADSLRIGRLLERRSERVLGVRIPVKVGWGRTWGEAEATAVPLAELA